MKGNSASVTLIVGVLAPRVGIVLGSDSRVAPARGDADTFVSDDFDKVFVVGDTALAGAGWDRINDRYIEQIVAEVHRAVASPNDLLRSLASRFVRECDTYATTHGSQPHGLPPVGIMVARYNDGLPELTVLRVAFKNAGMALQWGSPPPELQQGTHCESAITTFRGQPALEFLGNRDLIDRLLYPSPPLPIPLGAYGLQDALDLARFFVDYVSQLQRFLRTLPGLKVPSVGGKVKFAVVTAAGVTLLGERVLQSAPILDPGGPTLDEQPVANRGESPSS